MKKVHTACEGIMDPNISVLIVDMHMRILSWYTQNIELDPGNPLLCAIKRLKMKIILTWAAIKQDLFKGLERKEKMGIKA